MKAKLYLKFIFFTVLTVAIASGQNLFGQSQTHPSIWVNNAEKAGILNNIANYTWASNLNNQLLSRNNATVNTHKTSPQAYLNTIPNMPGDRNAHRNVLNTAVESAILYYLTGNEDYAQFSADVFQDYTKKVSVATTVNFYNDFFIESREVYPRIGIIYDFIHSFLNNTNTTIYNRSTGTRIAFDNNAAQTTVKKLADAVFNNGSLGSNHSVLEGNGALFNVLCIDNDAERAIYFNKFLNGTSKHDSFLNFTLNNFSAEEGIWPESVTYSKGPQEIVLQMLDVIDRYKPSLNVISDNLRIIDGAFVFENLKYPNGTIALYGDSRRNDDDTDNLYRRVLKISNRKNYPTYLEKTSKILKKSYDDNGGYTPSIITQTLEWDNPLDLLWGLNIDNSVVSTSDLFNTSAKITHAGIMLQRNYNGTNAKADGLVGFIGGAHYVHSHLSGIGMELYGKGYVMGAGGGDTNPNDRSAALYTNYYRIYAGHNTVVVNGASVGRGAGSWKADGLLFQNTAVNIAAEPASVQTPISNNFSFATQFLDDNVNNVDQQRTLSLVRTGPTTAYYLDIFRSKSNGTNNFHDYIYHNLGDDYSVTNLDGSSMTLTSTPSRYPANPVIYNGSTINFPGWQYFEDPQTSASTTAGAKVTFNLNTVSPKAYMYMLLPAGESREYTKTLAPPTLETDASYSNKKTNAIVVRQNGEAWNKPFVSVFEPSANLTSSVTNVENIVDNNVIVGAKVTSLVNGETITDYIISQPQASSTYTNSALNFSFSGRFGILRLGQKNSDSRVSMYIGEGTEMSYNGNTLPAGFGNKALLEYTNNEVAFIPEKIEIEAEDYNTGAQGVGYNDNDGINQGSNTTYRTDAVDISDFTNASNGIALIDFAGNLGNNNGDWMKYTFDVTNAGNYKLSVIASRSGAGTVIGGQINIDDTFFEKTINVASTGNSNTFAQHDVADLVYLSAGTHTMRYGSRASKSHNPDKFIVERQVAVLPVTLIKFQVDKTEDGNVVNWETASETNNSYFIVYRSIDGITFKELSRIAAKNKASKYQFVDAYPISGDNYYKLVQVDLDGKLVSLGVKSLRFDLKAENYVNIYPKPADRSIYIDFNKTFESSITVKLFDLNGKELKQVVIPSQKTPVNYVLTLDQKITTGIYIISIVADQYRHSEKLIVK